MKRKWLTALGLAGVMALSPIQGVSAEGNGEYIHNNMYQGSRTVASGVRLTPRQREVFDSNDSSLVLGNGVVLDQRGREIDRFGEDIPSIHQTSRMSPHPDEMLDARGVEDWLNEYNQLGGMNSYELAVISEINAIRDELGFEPLRINSVLQYTSRLFVQVLSENNEISICDSIYRGPFVISRLFMPRNFRVLVSYSIPKILDNNNRIIDTYNPYLFPYSLASMRDSWRLFTNTNSIYIGVGAYINEEGVIMVSILTGTRSCSNRNSSSDFQNLDNHLDRMCP